VELIDCATDALGLIDHFSGIDHAVIIDAAQMGEKPGTVKVFGKDDVRMMIKMDHLSVHGISLAETFEIAEAIDAMPKKLTIIGIEPETIAIAHDLSNIVKKYIPKVISQIISLKQLNNSLNGVKNA